ncbi:iron-containing alcohol dehydrogenase [Thalassotalea euphylliae]|uniref:Iron-containing alcohol dehydrogenase n=1 Tax=Thalassotalea euphylliae TaxID=1655234 RepID=A0A3E0UEP0_9GAMM|nr:iron-containing alcohol dehydrogenase [Thalassotalea euphylliae]REL35043.1 iron-containing alcohol dehydrogenase [Thalassotalea euphylliae]
MLNFSYSNNTCIHFGTQQIAKLASAIDKNHKVLLAYGGGSIKSNGVYQQVCDALAEHQVIEFSGIEPNPSYETTMKAVELVKSEQVDFILAVGGGSVIDGCKFIAAAAKFDGEPWDILAQNAKVADAVPLGVVLTLPATGSESNSFAVVSKLATKDKFAFGSPLVQPKFAILDPSVMASLPERQITNGIVDAFVHVMEQYLTYSVNAKVQDRFAEGILQTLIEEGPKMFAEPDADTRANVMWSATMALNGLIGAGVPQDWSTHGIGHEITALYGLDHAQTLAIILPRMMWEMREEKQAKLLQFARRIWHIEEESADDAIRLAIAKTEQFFQQVKMKTRLSNYQLESDVVEALVAQLERHGQTAMGETKAVTIERSRKIIELSL